MAARTTDRRRAAVVGAGPNGLAAAVALARAGWEVEVLEAAATIGGGARTLPLTLPGFRHDPCSAVHPLAVASPFLGSLGLERHGLAWVHPDAPLAHPLDDGSCVLLERSLDATAAGLGGDGRAWRRLFGPLVRGFDALVREALRPPLRLPRRPVLLARFGLAALRSGAGLARGAFDGERARALLAGLAAHSVLPLQRSPSAAFGLLLGAAAHAVGWPMPRGGAQALPDALAAELAAHGGTVRTGAEVRALADLPPHDAALLDLAPRDVARIAGDALPARYRRALERFRHGPGVFKLDWALSGPIPWRAPECARAGTVHLGGTLEEIAASERAAWRGELADRPFVLLAQPTLFDPTRAPEGRHVAWAYAHVPHGSTADRAAAIEAQVERFAPGFRDLVLARHAMDPAAMERHDANLVGGDVNGGAPTLRQLVARPAARLDPYATPDPRLFLCSASTPPGGGVHGMCGANAARSVLRRLG